MVAVAVAERVRDKNRNLKYHAPIPFYGKKGCSAKLLLFSYAEFFFSIFHCGENEKIISISHLDTENLMFFLLHSGIFVSLMFVLRYIQGFLETNSKFDAFYIQNSIEGFHKSNHSYGVN